jgi:large subunit ribosomal protein L18
MELKESRRQKRKTRIRGKISGTKAIPRLSVFRSNTHIYAQLINDEIGKSLCAVSDTKIKKGTKTEKAKEAGLELAKIAKEKKISKVVFDRSGYKFHGRVKSLAEGAREGGLQF